MEGMQHITWIPFDIATRYMVDVFTGLGVPHDDALICADVLITADKFGIDSHGVNRLKPIYYDRIKQGIQKPVTQYAVVKEGPTTAVIDGNDGMGQVIAYRSMQMAIDKAKKYGMGMVTVRNSTHYGIAGYYAKMAADNAMIGITGTNARPSVAPTFGVENMLGTNPLTFGIPADEDFPFLLDCATSVSQRGKIEVYARLNKPLPPGWVIDNHGNSCTNPHQVLDGLIKGSMALTPLGGIGEDGAGYKGYGYCTVVEILSAALQAGSYLKMLSGFDMQGNKVPYHLGHFFIAIAIEAFTDITSFKSITGDILRQLRTSARMPGQKKIYTAGEKEYLAYLERKDKGVPVNNEVMKELVAMRDELNITGYELLTLHAS